MNSAAAGARMCPSDTQKINSHFSFKFAAESARDARSVYLSPSPSVNRHIFHLPSYSAQPDSLCLIRPVANGLPSSAAIPLRVQESLKREREPPATKSRPADEEAKLHRHTFINFAPIRGEINAIELRAPATALTYTKCNEKYEINFEENYLLPN